MAKKKAKTPAKKAAKAKPVKKKVIEVEPEPEPIKEGRLPIKFFKICEGATQDERRLVADKVNRGELKLAYYGTDGTKGCHFYFIHKN